MSYDRYNSEFGTSTITRNDPYKRFYQEEEEARLANVFADPPKKQENKAFPWMSDYSYEPTKQQVTNAMCEPAPYNLNYVSTLIICPGLGSRRKSLSDYGPDDKFKNIDYADTAFVGTGTCVDYSLNLESKDFDAWALPESKSLILIACSKERFSDYSRKLDRPKICKLRKALKSDGRLVFILRNEIDTGNSRMDYADAARDTGMNYREIQDIWSNRATISTMPLRAHEFTKGYSDYECKTILGNQESVYKPSGNTRYENDQDSNEIQENKPNLGSYGSPSNDPNSEYTRY